MKKLLAFLILMSMVQMSFGQTLAPYREEIAALRPQIDKNIEQYRKGEVNLLLVDQTGKPVSSSEIEIKQETHSFKFGCNILVLGQLKEKNAAYEQAFLKLFNLATTTFCCAIYHPEKGKYLFGKDEQEVWRRPQPDSVLAFCQKNGITMKGQPIIAGSWHPDWMPENREETKKEYLEWIKKVAERYAGKVAIFDLVNESQLHKKPTFALYTPDKEYVGWAFKESQKIFPKDTTLEINESTGYAHNPNVYLKQLKELRAGGAVFDSVGFQFHFFNKSTLRAHLKGSLLPIKSLPGIYDQYCKLGVPLYITEITIPGTLGGTLQEGEAIQAEVTENLYRLWFSVPNMAGIIYWNLCDGAAWKNEGKAQAGLLDPDMREKPVYQRLYQLIHREWNTQLQTKTNEKGEVQFRGFYGRYRVVFTEGDKVRTGTFELTKDLKPVRVIVAEQNK